MDKNEMTAEMLRRTKQYALDILAFCSGIEESALTRPLITQLVKAGTSVGANYRATRRAKSKADFINKYKIVEEELDESLFFLEIFQFLYPEKQELIVPMDSEGNELLRIVVASLNTLRG